MGMGSGGEGPLKVTLKERLARVRHDLPPVLQTAGSAGIAYFISTEFLGHERPIFAALTAVIILGATRGQHPRRAVEMVIGVALGLAIAEFLVRGIGHGPWQLALVGLLAMVAAIGLGGGPLVVTQAGISAILVVILDPPSGLIPTRFFDALVGGGVALVISQVLFPFNPRTLVWKAAEPVFRQLVVTLEALADAVELGDFEAVNQALLRARDLDPTVRRFNDALSEGHRIARLAPPRRRARGQLEQYAVAATQIDLAVRNTRVLARAARGLVRLGGPAPKPVGEAIRNLAAAVAVLQTKFADPEGALETRELAVEAMKNAASVIEDPDALVLGSVVGQVRLTASDLLRATGMTLAEAQQTLDKAIGLE